MTSVINIAADLLLAILLVSTITSSMALSRRITRLKSDESAMRKTIAELIVASETAERAIGGLRTTLGECDRTLADRLRTAERYAADLAGQVAAGETVMQRIAQIVESSRAVASMSVPVGEAQPVPAKSLHDERLSAAALAAQALSERAARRLEGRAA